MYSLYIFFPFSPFNIVFNFIWNFCKALLITSGKSVIEIFNLSLFIIIISPRLSKRGKDKLPHRAPDLAAAEIGQLKSEKLSSFGTKEFTVATF